MTMLYFDKKPGFTADPLPPFSDDFWNFLFFFNGFSNWPELGTIKQKKIAPTQFFTLMLLAYKADNMIFQSILNYFLFLYLQESNCIDDKIVNAWLTEAQRK